MYSRVVLIGFRATGKTTMGRLLAERLGWEFVDLDGYLEVKFGKSVREIVEEGGWEAFRKEEQRAMREFAERGNLVLSLGGGAVIHEAEMKALKEGALVVWLVAPVEIILERLSRDPKTAIQRPSLTEKSLEEEVRELLSRREPLYTRFADLRISTAFLSPEKIVCHLQEVLRLRSK